MSQNIFNEVTFLVHSIMMGMVITFIYDWFLILRRLIRHNVLLISLEDMLFWISCAIMVFYMLYEENNGILRWFAVLGAAIGMILYKKTVSRLFVVPVSFFIAKIVYCLTKVLKVISKPFCFAGKKIGSANHVVLHKMCKAARFVKKKLTNGLKLLKITLCKH